MNCIGKWAHVVAWVDPREEVIIGLNDTIPNIWHESVRVVHDTNEWHG